MRYAKPTLYAAVAVAMALAASRADADTLSASMSLNQKASLAPDRITLTVTGIYQCSPFTVVDPSTDNAQIQIFVRQASGKSVTSAAGYIYTFTGDLVCDSTERTFEVNVISDQQPWHGGNAHADGSISIQSCAGGYPCEHAGAQTLGLIKISGGGGN